MTSSGLVCCAPAAPQKVRSAVKIAAWSLSIMIIPPFRPRGTIAPQAAVRQWRAFASTRRDCSPFVAIPDVEHKTCKACGRILKAFGRKIQIMRKENPSLREGKSKPVEAKSKLSPFRESSLFKGLRLHLGHPFLFGAFGEIGS